MAHPARACRDSRGPHGITSHKNKSSSFLLYVFRSLAPFSFLILGICIFSLFSITLQAGNLSFSQSETVHFDFIGNLFLYFISSSFPFLLLGCVGVCANLFSSRLKMNLKSFYFHLVSFSHTWIEWYS